MKDKTNNAHPLAQELLPNDQAQLCAAQSENNAESADGALAAAPCSAASVSQYIDYDGRPIIIVDGWTQIDYPVQKAAPFTFKLLSLLVKRLDKIRRNSHLRPTPLPTREQQYAAARLYAESGRLF